MKCREDYCIMKCKEDYCIMECREDYCIIKCREDYCIMKCREFTALWSIEKITALWSVEKITELWSVEKINALWSVEKVTEVRSIYLGMFVWVIDYLGCRWHMNIFLSLLQNNITNLIYHGIKHKFIVSNNLFKYVYIRHTLIVHNTNIHGRNKNNKKID